MHENELSIHQVFPKLLYYNECVHLVITCGHFQSRDKDGVHTICFAISENPMMHANLVALSVIEPELGNQFYIAGIGILEFFAPVTLTLTW